MKKSFLNILFVLGGLTYSASDAFAAAQQQAPQTYLVEMFARVPSSGLLNAARKTLTEQLVQQEQEAITRQQIQLKQAAAAQQKKPASRRNHSKKNQAPQHPEQDYKAALAAAPAPEVDMKAAFPQKPDLQKIQQQVAQTLQPLEAFAKLYPDLSVHMDRFMGLTQAEANDVHAWYTEHFEKDWQLFFKKVKFTTERAETKGSFLVLHPTNSSKRDLQRVRLDNWTQTSINASFPHTLKIYAGEGQEDQIYDAQGKGIEKNPNRADGDYRTTDRRFSAAPLDELYDAQGNGKRLGRCHGFYQTIVPHWYGSIWVDLSPLAKNDPNAPAQIADLINKYGTGVLLSGPEQDKDYTGSLHQKSYYTGMAPQK